MPNRFSLSSSQVRAFYQTLSQAWGPQHWWPARSRFEVIAGAYLTQNTSWTNVEKAMLSLRRAGALSLEKVRRLPLPELEQLIRSSGYFRQKALRLKAFVALLDARYGGSLVRMFAQPTPVLREELLALNGVGPETADSILLYAGNHPVFVVDAYTRRIALRHGLLSPKAEYDEVRALFECALRPLAQSSPSFPDAMSLATKVKRRTKNAKRNMRAGKGALTPPAGAAHLPSRMSRFRRDPLAQIYNEMHALFVGVGKSYCLKAAAKCEGCPLEKFPHLGVTLK